MAFARLYGWDYRIFDRLINVDHIIDGWCFTCANGLDHLLDGYLDT